MSANFFQQFDATHPVELRERVQTLIGMTVYIEGGLTQRRAVSIASIQIFRVPFKHRDETEDEYWQAFVVYNTEEIK